MERSSNGTGAAGTAPNADNQDAEGHRIASDTAPPQGRRLIFDGDAVAAAYQGKRVGLRGWAIRCPCPDHVDRHPSAFLSRSSALYCHKGCSARDMAAALDAAGFKATVEAQPVRPADVRQAREAKIQRAQFLWRDSDVTPYDTSVVASYLKHRGIELPVPPCMRRWQLNGWIACVTNLSGEITAVQHRLPIKHPITEGWLSSGEAIHAAECLGEDLALAEGLETALSVIQLTGLPCWATCGARRLPYIKIPPYVRNVYIFMEHDTAGIECSRKAYTTYDEQGFRTQLVWTTDKRWKDANDILKNPELKND